MLGLGLLYSAPSKLRSHCDVGIFFCGREGIQSFLDKRAPAWRDGDRWRLAAVAAALPPEGARPGLGRPGARPDSTS